MLSLGLHSKVWPSSIVALIYFIGISLSVAMSWADPCAKALQDGDADLSLFAEFHDVKGASIVHLGTGTSGGSVFRVVMPSGEKFSRKLYLEPSNLRNDVAAFAILVHIHETSLPVGGFRVAKVLRTRGVVMDLEYVEGRVLQDIFLYEKSDKVIEKYRSLYQSRLAALQTAVQAQVVTNQLIGERMRETRWLTDMPALRSNMLSLSGALKEVKLFIKPDNIIVTASDEFVIVDPY
jgi:hypothetical protein